MRILLLEPGYKNKYPPMALMKFSTYHKNRGDEVTFFKGNIGDFVVKELIKKACTNFLYLHPEQTITNCIIDLISNYIRKGSKNALLELESITASPWFTENLKGLRKVYSSKSYKSIEEYKWDRVYVTTLFTFYWDITIRTIQEAKNLVRNVDQLYVGGVCANILTDPLKEATGLKDHNILLGLMTQPGVLDKDDHQIIDDLPLDYSILDEIEYEYKENGNFYAYTTRGCVNKCPFCVVPKIEPIFKHHVSLSEKIKQTRKLYGDQKNLLLLDNNVMASNSYSAILKEIEDLGFKTGSYFKTPDYLTLHVEHIKNGSQDRGRLIKCTKLICQFFDQLTKQEDKNHYYPILNKNFIFCNPQYVTPSRKNILEVYEAIKMDYLASFKVRRSLRYVDFNQGVDSRLITDEKMELMAKIPIKPLRIAFDWWKLEKIYTRAVTSAARAGIKYLSNYLLYNFKDKPSELYLRMRKNVELSEEFDLQIFSFPMKYHPPDDPKYFSNRDYIGEKWNRKFVRAIQLVLNATKGKVGPRMNFFNHAFGKNEEEFHKILLMPEHYILYRVRNEENGLIDLWWHEFENLDKEEKYQAKSIIYTNVFKRDTWNNCNEKVKQVLLHYIPTEKSVPERIWDQMKQKLSK